MVCQHRPVQIHHIDGNNANNECNNLVVICHDHHDEAHTRRSLSQNLTPARLREFKKLWIKHVKEERNRVARACDQRKSAGSFLGVGITWGYINHPRVAQLLDDGIIREIDQNTLQRCVLNNIVDDRGIIIQPPEWTPSASFTTNTIYDWFPYGDHIALHILYSDFVDQIVRRINPTHLYPPSWTKGFVGNCLQEGDFIFFRKAQYFKRISESNENIHIRASTSKKKITLEYYIDTRNMFGTTSMVVSFSGHKSCSTLAQIKSIDKNSENWKLYCTPIALGVGFRDHF